MRRNQIKVYEANVGEIKIRNTDINKIIMQLDGMGHQARRDGNDQLAETYFQAAHHWICVKSGADRHV